MGDKAAALRAGKTPKRMPMPEDTPNAKITEVVSM